MIVNGIDLDLLDYEQFSGVVPGRTLILDGDGPCYAAASTSRTLHSALKKLQHNLANQMCLTESEYIRVHLTAQNSLKSGRYKIHGFYPYQGKRTGPAKPKPELLEPLRELYSQPKSWIDNCETFLHRRYEADDGMMMDSYVYKELGLIHSGDKDLRMTPYPYWEIKDSKIVTAGPVGSLFLRGDPEKCLGYGRKFFWAQMLMGDSADHVRGLDKLDGSNCGAKGAFNYLDPVLTEEKCANFVLAAYMRAKQNPMPEGWFLWMLRWEGDTFWHYLQELNLHPTVRKFVDDCTADQSWFLPKPEVFQDVPF
jgi:hypothetical protein